MRVKGGPATRNRRKKVLKLAKGYYGSKHTLFRTANQQVMKSLSYAIEIEDKLKEIFVNYGLYGLVLLLNNVVLPIVN